MSHHALAVALAFVASFVIGFVAVLVGHAHNQTMDTFVSAGSFVVGAGIVLFWFSRDAQLHKVRPSVWWIIGLVWPVISTFVVIGYLFRSRGLKRGLVANFILLALTVCWVAMLFAGSLVADKLFP